MRRCGRRTFDPFGRIGLAARHPGDIELDIDAGIGHHMLDRKRAVGQRLKLEIVIVPGKAQALGPDLLRDLAEALADRRPAGRLLRALLGRDPRTHDERHAELAGNRERRGEIALQLIRARSGRSAP